MGTRGCIGFRYKNKDYLTYNHYDSYPDGIGVSILKEISEVKDWNLVKKIVEKLIIVDDNMTPTKKDIKKYVEFGNPGVGESSINTEIHDWYQLLRNNQGTLKNFLDGTVTHMIDSGDFIKDSLFCEWAYVVNLDSMEFEVLAGFQHNLDEGSRYGTEPNKGGYYPCKLLKAYDLTKLPEEDLFEHNFKYNSDEEDYVNLDDDEVPYIPNFEAVPCCECGCTVGYIGESMYGSSLAIYCTECKEEKE